MHTEISMYKEFQQRDGKQKKLQKKNSRVGEYSKAFIKRFNRGFQQQSKLHKGQDLAYRAEKLIQLEKKIKRMKRVDILRDL